MQTYNYTDQQVNSERVLLATILKESKHIIVLGGAGTSVSAGIDDFRNPEGLPKQYGGKANFSDHVYRVSNNRDIQDPVKSTDSIRHGDFKSSSTSRPNRDKKNPTALHRKRPLNELENYHRFIQEAYPVMIEAIPPPFIRTINRLSEQNRLLRYYDMNIDGLSIKATHLFTQVPLRLSPPWPNVIQVHGSIQYMACKKSACDFCSPIDISLFQGQYPPQCEACIYMNMERKAMGKRAWLPIGSLRPRILLYDEIGDGWENTAISNVQQADQRSKADAFIVAGTSLHIPRTQEFVRAICNTVHRNGGYSVWVSKELPKQDMISFFDVVIQGTCDQLADFADSL